MRDQEGRAGGEGELQRCVVQLAIAWGQIVGEKGEGSRLHMLSIKQVPAPTPRTSCTPHVPKSPLGDARLHLCEAGGPHLELAPEEAAMRDR